MKDTLAVWKDSRRNIPDTSTPTGQRAERGRFWGKELIIPEEMASTTFKASLVVVVRGAADRIFPGAHSTMKGHSGRVIWKEILSNTECAVKKKWSSGVWRLQCGEIGLLQSHLQQKIKQWRELMRCLWRENGWSERRKKKKIWYLCGGQTEPHTSELLFWNTVTPADF